MRILAVDDKAMPRKVLVQAIEEAAPGSEVTACKNASEVLALPDIASYDVAFVDIDMPGMNGIDLARELKRIKPRINIVFATGFGEYMADAFAMHSSGYLMKPVTTADVAAELENLRNPPAMPVASREGKLVVRCFGAFEVFSGGHTLAFERAKSKELFAYLVDRRGAIVSLREAEAVLWEDSPRVGTSSGSYLRTLVADMKRTLETSGHGDVLVKRRGVLGVDMTKVSCDYYDYLVGEPLAINAWHGEYMNQYSWAESTKAALL